MIKCFFFGHHWTDWGEYEQPTTLNLLGRRDLGIPARKVRRIYVRRYRECVSCGKTQDEMVKFQIPGDE